MKVEDSLPATGAPANNAGWHDMEAVAVSQLADQWEGKHGQHMAI